MLANALGSMLGIIVSHQKMSTYRCPLPVNVTFHGQKEHHGCDAPQNLGVNAPDYTSGPSVIPRVPRRRRGRQKNTAKGEATAGDGPGRGSVASLEDGRKKGHRPRSTSGPEEPERAVIRIHSIRNSAQLML